MTDTLSPAAPSPAERFGYCVEGLRRVIAAFAPRNPELLAILLLIHRRLGQARQRFDAIAAQVAAQVATGAAAGTTPVRRARAASTRPPEAREVRPFNSEWLAVPLPGAMPRFPGWLGHLIGWQIRAHGGQIVAMLNQPDMAELVSASPEAARVVRQVLRLVISDPLPPMLRAPRARVRAQDDGAHASVSTPAEPGTDTETKVEASTAGAAGTADAAGGPLKPPRRVRPYRGKPFPWRYYLSPHRWIALELTAVR